MCATDKHQIEACGKSPRAAQLARHLGPEVTKRPQQRSTRFGEPLAWTLLG